MNQELWTAVDDYAQARLIPEDEVLEEALRRSVEAGLPQYHVSPCQGKLLHLLARGMGARRILEIGTLAGYSTIWMGRALPESGRLVTIEADPTHAKVAGENIARAGLSAKVELRQGLALDVLSDLSAEKVDVFDLVFIDADKPNTPAYFRAALELTRIGGMIIADNVVRGGGIADPTSEDPGVIGSQQLHELIASEPRVTATTIQTVGSKGYDGFTLAIVVG